MYIWIYMLVCWMEMSVWFLSMANLKLLIKSNVFSASVCKLICCHMSQFNERIMKWMKSMLLCVSINIGHMLTECSYFVWCCKFLCEPDAKQFRETKKKCLLKIVIAIVVTTLLAFELELSQLRAISWCLESDRCRRWKFRSRKFA